MARNNNKIVVAEEEEETKVEETYPSGNNFRLLRRGCVRGGYWCEISATFARIQITSW